MESVIIGNICSLFAMLTDSLSSSRKTAKGVLVFQTISQVFYVTGSIILKGYSAAVQNALSVLRNLAAIKEIDSKVIEWALVIGGVVLGMLFNNLGAIGWVPIIANFEYSLAVFRFKDNERALKMAFFVAVAMYSVFNFAIYNFVGCISNVIVAVTTFIFLVKGSKKD